MYNIVGTMKYWASLSIVLFLASIALWSIWGLNLGIDFTGGSSMQVRFSTVANRPNVQEMAVVVSDTGISNAHIQEAGESDYVIKAQEISNDQRETLLKKLKNSEVTEQSFANVGASLGSELKKKSIIAIILVLIAIIGYISYAFRRISRGPVPSWLYGVAAILALVHDIIIVIGVFVLLGKFHNVQIDALFVTALLTVLGFSVHDTIVVFDRIRERLRYRGDRTFVSIINESINTTLARSINTSLTTIVVLTALYLFGGEAIRYFVLALLVGIISGTYSSIFIASPLLLLGQRILRRSV